MFTEQSFAIYVLDDYSVHLMLKVRQALFKKGYFLVIIGGGITGDIQINDTNCHRDLKKHYRDLEMKLMLEQLEKDPIKIPSPSRSEMMSMLLQAWETLEIDTKREFKSLFVTNALDGSEDYLVSDKLFALIGDEMVDFWKELMSQNSVKTLKEVIRNLIPPKGVKRKANVEGSELLDCEGEEISLEEFQQECDEDEVTENDLAAVEDNSEVVDATTVQSNNDQPNSTSIPKHHVSFSNLTNDPDIKRDSEFLDKMHQIMTNGNTSKLFIPYLSQFRATYQKARRSVKKRIESKVPEKSTQEIDSHNIVEISTEGEVETVTPADSLSDETISINIENNEKPEINQYWEISNGKDSLYAYVVETDPFMVQFFEPNTSRSDAYRLNDKSAMELFYESSFRLLAF